MAKPTLWQFALIFGVILAAFIIYYPAFTSFYFQDDWFSLSISRAKTLTDIFKFFLPQAGVVYYRPLGMQIPFFISQLLFHFNPLPFRIATFMLLLATAYLCYRLLIELLQQRKLAIIGALLFLLSASYYIIFYWAATFAFALSPAFYFAAWLLFIKKQFKFSWLLFFCGLLINELLITLPLAIVGWYIYNEIDSGMRIKGFKIKYKFTSLPQIRKFIFSLTPFFILAGLYVLFRFTLAPFPTTGGYTFAGIGRQILVNLRDYILWTLNWPDEIHNQFASFFMLNPLFVQGFFIPVTIWIINTIVFSFLLWIIPLYKLWSRHELGKALPGVLLGLYIFITALLPVLSFSQHYFSYYVPVSLFGLLLSGLFLIKATYSTDLPKLGNTSLFVLLILAWGISTWQTWNFNTSIHWAPRRARLSAALVEQALQKYPQLPENATILLTQQGNNTEAKWALGDQNGLKVLYNHPNLQTFYGSLPEYLSLHPEINDSQRAQLFSLP